MNDDTIELMGAVKKIDREIVFRKYDGRCGYCGEILLTGWHVDHIEPVCRIRGYDKAKNTWVYTGKDQYPGRNNLNNYMPSCASCNINKHGLSIEEFRNQIQNFIISLNKNITQYKIAKRYGLIIEKIKPVLFFYEIIDNTPIKCDCVSESIVCNNNCEYLKLNK